ncbi:hypothetical protein HZU40_22535 [Mycolicibacterium fluoranthenivorans]|uniref:Uncharacterized protein n=1 Tax=Mycolicibacterium fluoranthenivorans TaxID=258505 RepID=A0A7G8P9H7_9MYCO|nr:hypothetical protein [Mycolicibacterium fluoranthenivorans]QNJ90993.1 hypothetical protein HZU40_22535 [Mycolicibacterium fluoranthenivorans]
MNVEWMRMKLEAFSASAKRYDQSIDDGSYAGNEQLRQVLYRAEPTARKILERLDPGLADRLDLNTIAGAAVRYRQWIRHSES